MISNEKLINYKVVDLFEHYNFDITFVYIWLDLEKLLILLNLFLEKGQIANCKKNSICRYGWNSCHHFKRWQANWTIASKNLFRDRLTRYPSL